MLGTVGERQTSTGKLDDQKGQRNRDMVGRATTPASSYLYTINDINPVLLDTTTAETYHSNVLQLLYLGQRGRPDIVKAVSFLTTRVHRPDVDDKKKLSRVMKNLHQAPVLFNRKKKLSPCT
jgi:hypothetical protein